MCLEEMNFLKKYSRSPFTLELHFMIHPEHVEVLEPHEHDKAGDSGPDNDRHETEAIPPETL